MICKKCAENYQINGEFKCSFILDSDINKNSHTNNNTHEEESKIDSMIDDTATLHEIKTWFLYAFISIFALLIIIKVI